MCRAETVIGCRAEYVRIRSGGFHLTNVHTPLLDAESRTDIGLQNYLYLTVICEARAFFRILAYTGGGFATHSRLRPKA
jgi:hypothetical protein